jgi:hypothetical protein
MLDMEDLKWLKDVLDEVWTTWNDLKPRERRMMVRRRGRLTVATEMDGSSCNVLITDGERALALVEEQYSSDLGAVRDFLALVFGEGSCHPQLLDLVRERIEEIETQARTP